MAKQKTVVIVVEDDALKAELYIGRSGDFTIINHFFSCGYSIVLVQASSMQRDYHEIECLKIDDIAFQGEYTGDDIFEMAIQLEYQNIADGKTPSHGIKEGLTGRIFTTPCNLPAEIELLLSRAMPQSLSQNFARNFVEIGRKAKKVPQDIAQICLYKDKTIPYILQSSAENIERIYEEYSKEVKQFKSEIKGDFSHLALKTVMLDASKPFQEAVVERIAFPLCIKPFNLFGGIGVGVFKSSNGIIEHIEKINQDFEKYSINEKRLILVQEAVQNPEFGDIRSFFSMGRFLGAFKRYEPVNKIHNTMNGARIIPICDESFNFAPEFEEHLRQPFRLAVMLLTKLFAESSFLKLEFICGCDFLLDGNFFKLTEINIACPTGFAFLEASIQCIKNGGKFNLQSFIQYYTNNGKMIEKILDDVMGR